MRIFSMFVAIGLAFAALHETAYAIEQSQAERPLAIDGSQYAAVAPVYDGASGGLQSFLRLYNASSAASTYTVVVVNAATGATLGSATIQMPGFASQQFPVTPAGGTNSILTQAGVTATSDTAYALYIQNPSALAGYQHVTFNQVSLLFENASVCATPMSHQLASSNRKVLTNVHSSLFDGNYPSGVNLHNYSNIPTTAVITVRNAATGASFGQVVRVIGANTTLTLTSAQVETALNIAASDRPFHFNFVVTGPGSTVPVVLTHNVRAVQLGGQINMTETCAVNAVSTAATAAAPASYCGTFRYPSTAPAPYNLMTLNLVISVAPGGRIIGAIFGNQGDTYDGAYITGTLSGTSFTATSSEGVTSSGTVQNGVLSGSFNSELGALAFSATAAACN